MRSLLNWRHVFLIATLATLAALLALPPTRVLLGMQMESVVLGASGEWYLPSLHDLERNRLCRLYADVNLNWRRRLVEKHPHDVGMHIAFSYRAEPNAEFPDNHDYPVWNAAERCIEYLRSKEGQFDNEPAYHAAILRLASSATSLLAHRPERMCYRSSTHRGAPPPERILKIMERAAQIGEKLDPHNGYFPQMAAVVLYARHRDAEALATLRTAAGKPRWNDYVTTDTFGLLRLQERLTGHVSPPQRRMVVWAPGLSWHGSAWDPAAMALHQALTYEKAGYHNAGIAIRHDLLRLGDTIRRDASHTAIAWDGMAITGIAAERPGGARSQTVRRTSSRMRLYQKRFDPYLLYLQKRNRRDEAEYAQRVRDAAMDTYRILAIHDYDAAMIPYKRWAVAMAVGVALLSNAAWVLVLGGLAWAFGCSRRVAEGKPLPAWKSRSIATATLLATGAASAYFAWVVRFPWEPQWWLYTGTLFSAACAVSVWFTRPRDGRPIACIAVGTGGAALLVGLAFAMYRQSLFSLPPLADPDRITFGILPDRITFWILVASVAIPLTLTAGIAAIGVKLRIPVTVGLIRGLRALAVPIACGLFFVYAASAAVATFFDRQDERIVRRLAEHHARFIASSIGAAWPEAAAGAKESAVQR